jgi:hypothetical protein
MGLASAAATAEPLPFYATWSISFSTDKAEVTALGDGNKVYVAGLPDASGDFSGFWDDTTTQTFTSAADGAPRKFYLYPDLTNAAGVYWYGTILPDFKIDGAVGDAVKVAASWNAASAILKSTA